MPETPPTGPDFSRCDGLLPAIAQDATTGKVLMMAYMNAESYAETVATGRAVITAEADKNSGARGKKAETFNS
jgi:phosphoribosyl-AMP cyclohydrolase